MADENSPIPDETGATPAGSGSENQPIPSEQTSPVGKSLDHGEPIRVVQEGRQGERTVDAPLSDD